jgi:hypothetical protein
MDGEAGFLREQGREAQKAVPSNARTGMCELGYLTNDCVSPWMAALTLS